MLHALNGPPIHWMELLGVQIQSIPFIQRSWIQTKAFAFLSVMFDKRGIKVLGIG